MQGFVKVMVPLLRGSYPKAEGPWLFRTLKECHTSVPFLGVMYPKDEGPWWFRSPKEDSKSDNLGLGFRV